MIATDLEHAALQVNFSPPLRKAFEFLQQTQTKDLPDGRIDIDGNRVYALVQSYESRPQNANPTFEAHRNYVDVQYVVSGSEIIGWAPLDQITITEAYDKELDTLFGVAPGEYTPVRLSAGQLVVLYPVDTHAPGLAAGEPSPVKKIVIKVTSEGW
jgi:YhcH/YjgK/YiaL family protein